MDITSKTAYYSCKNCRDQYMVTFGSRLFPSIGGGMASMTDHLACFWLAVHDVPVTTACKIVGWSQDVVSRWYDTARDIMCDDALEKQSKIIFGELPDNKTADFECDEMQCFKWREDPVGDDQEVLYHYYVWVGIYQRGAPEKLALKERGIRTSRGEGRIPPLDTEFWLEFCAESFNEKSNMVQMSDSAAVYTSRPFAIGIVDGDSVNHSRKPIPELSRSIEVLADVVTKEKRPAVCSTNLIDPTWRRVKEGIPDSASAKTPADRIKMTKYVRAQQWKIMLSTYDRWAPFVAAAARYAKKAEAANPSEHGVGRRNLRNMSTKSKNLHAANESVSEKNGDLVPQPLAACASTDKVELQPLPNSSGKQQNVQIRSSWACPPHSTLERSMGTAMASAPQWYNNVLSEAVANGKQTGSTCGLHACNHVFASAAHLRSEDYVVLSKEQFVMISLASRHGDAEENLVQPGGSNYDISCLLSNCGAQGLSLHAILGKEIEERLEQPFEDLCLLEGRFQCAGYILRIPSFNGHWISILPLAGWPNARENAVAILWDSLYLQPFWLTQSELQGILIATAAAMAGDGRHDYTNMKWGCFFAGIRFISNPLDM